MKSSGCLLLVSVIVTCVVPYRSVVCGPTEFDAELDRQYDALIGNLDRRNHIAGLTGQTYHESALIDRYDIDPADIVLRRTRTLLNDIQSMFSAPDLSELDRRLSRLESMEHGISVENISKRKDLYREASLLRRRIAFSNPLLDFDCILVLKRHRARFNHMCDQYYGINAVPGGGLFVLSEPFGKSLEIKDVLADSVVKKGRLKGRKLSDGSFLSQDLSFDGETIAFAYVECEGDKEHRYHTDPGRGHWNRGRSYHVFRVGVDGTGLMQLTDGTWNDFDPCWMPSGRLAYITERRGGYLRCGRVCPTYTLYDMDADGGDNRCLSPHETNEWHPSVTREGRIIYTRWDYVDRHGCVAHMPWITTPDGRDARAVHGNFAPRETRADMELDIRAIPGSHKYVATGAPHHGQAFGSLVIVDPRVEDDDAMAPVKRLTPEVDFPETQNGAQVYGTAWPLSEKYYLCAYDPDMKPKAGRQGRPYLRGNYGIYLIDVFGNKELVYRDPEIASMNPVPLRVRKTPPVMPSMPSQMSGGTTGEATLGVINVYNSRKPWPAGTKIEALRVYQIIPMSVPSGTPAHEIGMRLPGLEGSDSVMLARYVLGTVPVETDGSAYFVVPSDKEIFFQALDENGLAVQSMRSGTYLKPGEHLTCQGCHEPSHTAPGTSGEYPIAFRRGPSRLKPDVDGTNPFSYPRLVQPVLDKHCLSCHEENPEKAPRLDREVLVKGRKKTQKWYASYFSLAGEQGFRQYDDRHRTTPGKFGARASKLHAMLKNGHHGLSLPEEDFHRINVWLDSCSIFYGVYEKESGEAQLKGEIVSPSLE